MTGRRRLPLAGKVALVTGGAAGIGHAVATEMRQRGAEVVVSDTDVQALEAAAAGLGVTGIEADVRDRERMQAVVREVCDVHGRLDVVVANAGVTPRPGTVRCGDLAEFDRVIAVNLTGALNTVQPALGPLAESGGHAVLVASAAAFTATPCGAAYSASKAAVEALGRALRLEMAPHGVSVGLAYFGIVETEMTRSTLDGSAAGAELGAMLPWPLGRRISARSAARSLVDGVEQRAARTVAPAPWLPYSLLRGTLNIGADAFAASSKRLHRVIAAVERGELDAPVTEAPTT